jgi:creatinine amidohydrolase
MKKHLLQDMTFLEFRERMANDPVILIPLGSQEIQGPRVPMGDFMLTREIAARVAARTGAIAAPTMPFGYAEYFRSVPGGVQLSAATFRGVLRDMVGAFLDHGLNRILVLNGHTGNSPQIDQSLREIRAERGIVVPWVNVWRMLPPSIRKQAHGDNAAAAFGHGADPMGSMYLHMFPELVRSETPIPPETPKTLLGLPTGGLAFVLQDGLEVNVPVNVTDHCDAIVGGNPDYSNPDAGRLFADYVVETTAKLVEHLKTAPQPHKAGDGQTSDHGQI